MHLGGGAGVEKAGAFYLIKISEKEINGQSHLKHIFSKGQSLFHPMHVCLVGLNFATECMWHYIMWQSTWECLIIQ